MPKNETASGQSAANQAGAGSVSAQQVYAVMTKHSLTEEQRLAIEAASTSGPSLIIAGAGSGKTELMATRALWLIANRHCKPSQILGLTFTRKAAAELSSRVMQALYRLRETELWPEGLEYDFEPPNISTYNSFANELFRQYSLLVGFEADAPLLGEAASFQLARELIIGRGHEIDERLSEADFNADSLIEAVLKMAAAITENSAQPSQVQEQLDVFIAHSSKLPQKPGGSLEHFKYTQDFLASAQANHLISKLAEAYLQEKRNRNSVDFSDQVALALAATGLNASAPTPYSFVLLDEYQDTSPIQTQLLSTLFHKQAVMAVGDPNQAIYGWRGASASNLASFFTDFGAEAGRPFTLSTSWRSGGSVVAAANHISEPLTHAPSYETGATVLPIRLAAAEGAEPGQVWANVSQDQKLEAEAVADWLFERVTENTTAALLVRSRSSMQRFADALRAKGLAVEVSGLGGLLKAPEIIDLVSTLKVLHRPTAGVELMRLLSGPRFRIAPRDLAQLDRLAKSLTKHRPEANSANPVTLVEALDEFNRAKAPRFGDFSEAALSRLGTAAALLARMRSTSGLGLTEFTRAVSAELWLDIELLAMPGRVNPLANLDAFYTVVADYEAASLRPTLASFLNWLDYAQDRERLEAPSGNAKNGVVQILTAHSSKGLEWDHVVVANLNEGDFPVRSKEARGWLNTGQIPWALRRDAGSLPEWPWAMAETQKELNESFSNYQGQLGEHRVREERRLAYVAMTRAKQQLLLTASYWKRGLKNPKPLSTFLTEILEAGLAAPLSEITEPASQVNPLDETSEIAVWPIDPLGLRREGLERAAAQVSSAAGADQSADIQLLLEERESLNSAVRPPLPVRLSASSLAALAADTAGFARRLLRPVPHLAGLEAQLGTRFHATLESAFRSGAEVDLVLEELIESKPDLAALATAFQSSEFASRTPKFTEKEIQLVLEGFILVCKLDAVFETASGYEIIDWKTGAAPKGDKEVEAKSLQLALYRFALAESLGVGVEKVEASFFYVSEGQKITPKRLLGESEIKLLLRGVRTARQQPARP